MNCLETQEHFSAFLEDELSYDNVKAFEGHLSHCETCHHEFSLFRQSIGLLNQLPSVELSPHFDTVLQMRLADVEMESMPFWILILEGIRRQPLWTASGLATAVLLAFAGIYLYQAVFVNPSQIPTIVEADATDSVPQTALRRIDTSPVERLSRVVPRLNVQEPFSVRENEALGSRSLKPPRLEQNYILQTIHYADVPTSGGL